MDKAIVYNKALSKNEIRTQMQLIKYLNIPSDNIVGYWQLNSKTLGNTTLNSVSCKNQGQLNNLTTLAKSTAPLGLGTSEMVLINTGGNVALLNTNLNFGLASTGNNPNGEMVFTYLKN